MSEWKDRLNNIENETPFCTGWGIIDGIIKCVKNMKKKYNNKKSTKQKLKNLKD